MTPYQSELFEFFRDELVNIHGRSVVPNLVLWDGRVWLHKPAGAWPELLAYRCGGTWLNIPEAVTGRSAEGATAIDGTPLEQTGGPLIRLGQDYRPEELPVQDLDEAIASELVFSLWIRRRDAHPWNRVYVDGLPIFFDHHVAFGTEPNHRSLDGFFEPGYDGGYASHWRLQLLPQGMVPTTLGERRLPPDPAMHRVRDPKRFDSYLDRTAERIAGFSDATLASEASRSGAPNPDEVAALLAQTRDELHEALSRLRAVIRQPP